MIGLHYGEAIYSEPPLGTTLSDYPAIFQSQYLSDGSESFSVDSLITKNTFARVLVAKTALKFKSFKDDWYERIHVIPPAIDLLNVVSDQVRTIIIWNAFFVNKTLSATIFPVATDITVTSPVSTPYSFKALQTLTYSLTVTAIGSPTIDETLTWVISGEQFNVPVIGRRVIVWPFEPNWLEPFSESLDWLTDVIVSYSGKEQRAQIRSRPRRGFEYSSLLKKESAAQAANLLWGWQNRMYGVPVWFDNSNLTVAASIGTIILSLDTTGRGFFSGGLLLLFNNPLDYEAAEILSFSSSTVTLKIGTLRAWPLGTKVYPINLGRLPADTSYSRITDGVKTLTTSFNFDPVQNDPYIPTAAAPLSFSGYEVILKKPNWASPVDVDSHFDYDILDFSTGAIAATPTREYPQLVRRFEWLLKTRQEILDFRALLGRCKGRAKAAYLPTWFSDFQLYATESSSSVVIRVLNNEFYKMVGVNGALNTLMIQTSGNAPIFRKIDNVTLDVSGFVTLTLSANIGVDLNSTTKPRLSLVHLCRLSSDKIVINWLSNAVATVQANFSLVDQ